MSIMHTTEVKALIELQAKDKLVDDIAAKIKAVPQAIAALNAEFEEKKKSMNTAKETLSKLQVEKKSKELTIAEKDEEIRKHQKELNMVKENNAFKALLSEIEKAKKVQDDMETEILVVLEAIDKAVVEDKRLQQEVKKVEEAKNVKIKELEASAKDLEAALAAAKAERAAFAEKIGGEVMEKYEFIRAQRQGIAIVVVKEDKAGKISCGGCNISLTPQKIVDIKKRDVVIFCDNCQRMIYLEKTIYG